MTTKRRRVQVKFTEPSLTKQAFKEECDINAIMAKYEKTGLLDHVNKVQGNFGDFSEITDYQSALNAVMDANDRFNGLPAHLRAQFQNDPAQFINFVSDDKNYDKAIELDLIDEDKKQAYLAKKEAALLKSQQAAQPALKPQLQKDPQ